MIIAAGALNVRHWISRPRPAMTGCLAVAVGVLLLAAPANATLTISPITWNVIGLDSNNVNVGPNHFPVGARVCSDTAVSVTVTFHWDSTNTYIDLRPGTLSTLSLSIAAGGCQDAYFEAEVTRNSSAYTTSRRYYITATDGTNTVSTPTPRELYVEYLISQSRNSVNNMYLSYTQPTAPNFGTAISPGGTMTLMVGQTYWITLEASTATNGYEQIESFINFPNIIFQVLSVSTTYTADSSATVNPPYDTAYGDACVWYNDPTDNNYRSCLSTGKLGGDVTVTYKVKILQLPPSPDFSNPEPLNSLIYDFSGSSYHYNSDFSASVRYANIVNASIVKSFSPKSLNPNTLPAQTSTLTFTITNPGPDAISSVNFVDNLPKDATTSTYQMTIASTTVTYSNCGSPSPSSLTVGQTSLSFTNITVNGTNSLPNTCTIAVTVTVPEHAGLVLDTYNNTSNHLFIGSDDTGSYAQDTLVATDLPAGPLACGTYTTLATWTMPTSGQGSGGPPPPYTTIDTYVSTALATTTAVHGLTGAGSQAITTGGVTTNAWDITDAFSAVAANPGPVAPYFEFQVDTHNYGGVRISFQYDLEAPGDWASNSNDTVYVYSSTDGTNFVNAGSATATKSAWQPAVTATAATTGVSMTWFRVSAVTRGNKATSTMRLDNVTIDGCPRPKFPRLSKSFTSPICTNPTSSNYSTLTFTIRNDTPPGTSTALTGVGFTDTLPTGLKIDSTSTNPPSVSCSQGSLTGATISAAPGSTSISMSGGSLGADSICTFTVRVDGQVAGNYTNVSGSITSNETGYNTSSSGYGTSSLTAIAQPVINKTFGKTNLITGDTTSLTFSITNPNASTTLTGVTFTDTLPAGLDVSSSTSSVCGGTNNLTTNDNNPAQDTIVLSSTSMAGGASCTFSVNVTGTTAGQKDNSVQVTSTNGCTGNTANASVLVRAPQCTVSVLKKVGTSPTGPWYSYLPMPIGSTVYYQFTVENDGETPLNTVSVSDTSPNGGLICGSGCTCTWPTPIPTPSASNDNNIVTCVPTLTTTVSGTVTVNDTATVTATSTSTCNSPQSSASYLGTNPTAVIIGQVGLAVVSVSDFLRGIGAPDLDAAGLLKLLSVWDPAAAASLQDASRDVLWQALVRYLDPDGDGQVVVLRWQTVEERGTVGFFAERRQGGAWVRINGQMLPGLIAAPMGAEYWLADPGARPNDNYQYRLIEVEARGTTREYGPFDLRAGSAAQ